MSRSELGISRWLEAHSNSNADLNTFSRNIILTDVTGDSTYMLVLADVKIKQKSRLKVYKGTIQTSDQILPDVPSSVTGLHGDSLEPRVPAVAIACCSDLLIYKNNKPYYKFCVPPIRITALEEETWKKFADLHCDYDQMIGDLKSIPYGDLSTRSQELLFYNDGARKEYIQRYFGVAPIKISVIVATCSLTKTNVDLGIACLVIGTENGDIYILDMQTFTILHEASVRNLKATPAILQCLGMYDSEYKIIIASRENSVSVLKRGWLEGKLLFQLSELIVDMITSKNGNIIVATTARNLQCYSKKGQKIWSTTLMNYITCMTLIPLTRYNTHLIAVGLKGGPIHIYHENNPVDYTNVGDSPSALVFGELGQEEHVMVIVTASGSIVFKILKRTADFDLSRQQKALNNDPQSKPLPLPKRSKLFLEQSMRERQNSTQIHRTFQVDLVKLRLRAARALVDNLTHQSGFSNSQEEIKMSAQVLGLGPKFTLNLIIENMNATKAITELDVILHANPVLYSLDRYFVKVTLIPPGLSHTLELSITQIINDIDKVGDSGLQKIKVFVTRKNQKRPVLAVDINLPPIELTSLLLQ